MFFHKGGRTPDSRCSVSEDWIKALPREKTQAFNVLVGTWESLYAMMSVSLDDSIALRTRGELVCARQQISVTVELYDRVSSLLIHFCEVVERHSRHLSRFPAVEPLNTRFFRGNIGQKAAHWNLILHRVLFADSSRFHHKVRILSDTLRRLDREFRRATAAVSKSPSAQALESWKMLDCIHYDFNTCLRENEVLLKSFLRALPSQNLSAFEHEMGITATPVSAHARLSGASA